MYIFVTENSQKKQPHSIQYEKMSKLRWNAFSHASILIKSGMEIY